MSEIIAINHCCRVRYRSALQSLHRVSAQAREHNFFEGGLTHDWITHYEKQISSDQSCLNEWNAMDSIESRRPPSPDSLRTKYVDAQRIGDILSNLGGIKNNFLRSNFYTYFFYLNVFVELDPFLL